MKVKLVKYSAIILISFFTLIYAGPNYKYLTISLNNSPKEKDTTTLLKKKPDAGIAKINKSHQFKAKLINSTRPVQRCLKNLKI